MNRYILVSADTKGSLDALRYLSNVHYLKNSEKWYYMLQK